MIYFTSTVERNNLIKRAASLSNYFTLHFHPNNIDDLILKRRLSRAYIDYFKNTWKILEEYFPGQGEIQFELEADFKVHVNRYGSNHATDFTIFNGVRIAKFYLVLHWPEITITNSAGREAKIVDLFTRIPVNLTDPEMEARTLKLEYGAIEGTRITISPVEWSAGYSHSHLPGKNFNSSVERASYVDFCTGSGDIRASMALCNSDPNDYDLLILYLNQIPPFVQWESLEGSPYRRIEHNTFQQRRIPTIGRESMDYIYRKLQLKVATNGMDLDWKYERGQYQIIPNQKFDDLFDDIIKEVDLARVYRSDRGEYYVRGNITNTFNIPEGETVRQFNQWIPFRGQRRYFKVDTSLTPKTEQEQISFIHPEIKEYVRKRFQETANFSQIREVGISKLNKGVYH